MLSIYGPLTLRSHVWFCPDPAQAVEYVREARPIYAQNAQTIVATLSVPVIGLIGAACAGVMLQVIAGITSASQEDSILMKFSWDGAISWRGIILALVLLVFTRYIKKTKDLHPIVFIGVSAVIGVVFHFAGV